MRSRYKPKNKNGDGKKRPPTEKNKMIQCVETTSRENDVVARGDSWPKKQYGGENRPPAERK